MIKFGGRPVFPSGTRSRSECGVTVHRAAEDAAQVLTPHYGPVTECRSASFCIATGSKKIPEKRNGDRELL